MDVSISVLFLKFKIEGSNHGAWQAVLRKNIEGSNVHLLYYEPICQNTTKLIRQQLKFQPFSVKTHSMRDFWAAHCGGENYMSS